MDMKISSIRIKCRKRNVFIQLSNNISFIYGNTGVGKTTLLNLISYGLGNNLVKTLAVEQEVLEISLNVWLKGELLIIDRKMNSNVMILTRNDEKVKLLAKDNSSHGESISDFFYESMNLEPVEMLKHNSTKEVKVNFSNFMWFSYLRQEELDNTLFYLGEQKNIYKEYASIYVMKVLLGAREVAERKDNKRLNYLKEQREVLQMRAAIANRLCASTKLMSVNLGHEVVRKQRDMLILREQLEQKIQVFIANCPDIDEGQFEQLLDMQERLGKYEAEIRYLEEFSKINRTRNKYLRELEQCEKSIHLLEEKKQTLDADVFQLNLKSLEDIFYRCLNEVCFAYIEPTDYVKIDRRRFVPSIYARDGEFKFDYSNLSSGGKKTIFKICYALAIHIYVKENEINSILPQFIMIDTPMKNISEREDRILYENLYGFFERLFSEGGELESVQLIIVDKELPQSLEGKSIMCKHMTNEEPLIPCY